VQFLLDLFALFLLYLIISVTISTIGDVFEFNRQFVAGDELAANPYPLIVWSVAGLLVFAAGVVMPLVFRHMTKMRQKQYDMWVYAVLLIRILGFMTLFELMGIHLNVIMKQPESLFNLTLLMNLVLIVFIVRFTKIRIKAAEPAESHKKRRILED
jgi:hypothetical protein